jgi:hypothetical protein
MNADVLRGKGPSNEVAVSRLRWATFVLLGLTASGAFALDSDLTTPVVIAQAGLAVPGELPRPQFEVSASTLPRFENIDGSSQSSRLDMTWLPPRRSALGLSLGMTGTGMDGPGLMPSGQRAGLTPSLDLGLHWRYTLDSNYRIDVTAWRRMMPPDALTLVQTRDAAYGARVEMRIGRSPPRNGLVAERGFIGLQLESGARVTLKRSGGKPMLYYRSKF